jgi:hypothetical protein
VALQDESMWLSYALTILRGYNTKIKFNLSIHDTYIDA